MHMFPTAAMLTGFDPFQKAMPSQKPRPRDDRSNDEIWDLSLAEVIHLALVRDEPLGARGDVRTDRSVPSTNARCVPSDYDEAIRDSGLVFGGRGADAALSAAAGVSQATSILRPSTFVSTANAETNVQNLLRDVEETYWDLYLAFRKYDTYVEARNSHLRSRLFVWTHSGFSHRDGRKSDEAYLRARVAGEGALRDLYALETKLRRLCGLPEADGRIIRPKDDPTLDELKPDWNVCLAETLARHKELRRLERDIKNLEVQLGAAEDFADPRLNVVPIYVLRLVKARQTLADREHEIRHELRTAFQNLSRRYQTAQSNYNRWQLAEAQITERENRYRTGVSGIDRSVLLQQWRETRTEAATAEVAFYASVIEYQKAIIDLNWCQGTLLERHNVLVAE